MRKHILIIPGDGIGKEVTVWGKAVLAQIATDGHHEFIFDDALMGHAAIEATGSPLPDETLAKAKSSDAILFGAVGHAKYDNDPTLTVRPEGGLLGIRKQLALYANIRPVVLFDELLDVSSIKPDVIKGTDILFFASLPGTPILAKRKESGIWHPI